MNFIKSVFLIAFVIINFTLKAQYDGELQFVGRNFLNNKPLNFTKVRVMNGTTVVSEFSTKNSNNFKTTLQYGNVYDIYLINTVCHTMYIREIGRASCRERV